jgi:hypothetical protein
MEEKKAKKYFGFRHSVAVGMKGFGANLKEAGLFSIARSESNMSPAKATVQRSSGMVKSVLSPQVVPEKGGISAAFKEFNDSLKQCMEAERFNSHRKNKKEREVVRLMDMDQNLFNSMTLYQLPEDYTENINCEIIATVRNLEAIVVSTWKVGGKNESIITSKMFELETTTSTKKTICETHLPKRVLAYKLSPNGEYLFLLYSEQREDEEKERLYLGIYKFPNMEELDLLGPITSVNIESSEPFGMYFTFQHQANDEGAPDYLVMLFKERILTVNLSEWDWNSATTFELKDTTPDNYSGCFDNLTKMNFEGLFVSETYKIDQDRKELMAWRWTPYDPEDFTSANSTPISISTHAKVIPDSVSSDGNHFYGYSFNGKEIFKVDLKLSKYHFIYQFSFEDKYIIMAKVIKDGKFILIADSTNDLMVYYMNENNSYEMLNCFDFSESINSFDLSVDNEVIYVLKDFNKLVTIPIHLGRVTESEFIRLHSKDMKLIDLHEHNQNLTLFMYSKFQPTIVKASSRMKSSPSAASNTSSNGWDSRKSFDRTIQVRRRIENMPTVTVAYWNASELLVEVHDETTEAEWVYSEEEKSNSADIIDGCKLSCEGDFLFVKLRNRSEVWSLQEMPPVLIQTCSEREIIYEGSSSFVYKWNQSENQSIIEVLEFNEGDSLLEKTTEMELGEGIQLLKGIFIYEYDVMVLIGDSVLMAFDEDPTDQQYKYGRLPITRIIDPNPDVIYEGNYISILDRRNRVLFVVKIDPDSLELISLVFEVNSALMPIRSMCFTHDTHYLLVLDSSMIIKVYSVELQRKIGSINLDKNLNQSWDLSYFCTSVNSKELLCVFKSSASHSPAQHGFHIMRIPFFNTRYNPLKSVLGSYLHQFFSSETYSKKDVMASTILTKIKTYDHYQVAINNLYTIILFLMDHPSLIENFSQHYLDFNLISKICLPLIQQNFNKLESLKSFMAMFNDYCKDLGECPYIDQKVLLRLLYSEGIQIQNRYTRSLIGKILFAPVKTVFGELVNESDNVAVLEKDFTKTDIETYSKKLMAKDPTNLNAYTCCVSKIPLDLSNGSQFSVSFFGNIDKFSDEDIRERYRVFIYYKWRLIYYYALVYAIIYWFMNSILYAYFGKFNTSNWLGWLLVALSTFFILFEIKCIAGEAKKYFKQFLNIVSFGMLVLCLVTVLVLLEFPSSWNSNNVHAMRIVSTVAISIRGIMQLRVFKQTRYIVTMLTQVFINVYPFMVVFIYVILIMTFLWILEPLLEGPFSEQLGFYEAIQRLVNTAFGNFYMEPEDSTYLRFFTLIVLNIVVGLILLNFLIALISSTYESVDQKRDLYDVREILPVIKVFDRFFKSIGNRKVVVRRRKKQPHLTVPRFSLRSSIIGKGAFSEGTKSKSKHRNEVLRENQNIDRELGLNNKKRHFLCLIPENDANDRFKMIKRNLEQESTAIQEAFHHSTDMVMKNTSELGLKVKDVDQRLMLMENKLDNSLSEIRFLLQDMSKRSAVKDSGAHSILLAEGIKGSGMKAQKIEKAGAILSRGLKQLVQRTNSPPEIDSALRDKKNEKNFKRVSLMQYKQLINLPEESLSMKQIALEFPIADEDRPSIDQKTAVFSDKIEKGVITKREDRSPKRYHFEPRTMNEIDTPFKSKNSTELR